MSFSEKSRLDNEEPFITGLASVGILGKEREPGVGKLGWHGNFNTVFERNTVISFKIPCAGLWTFLK